MVQNMARWVQIQPNGIVWIYQGFDSLGFTRGPRALKQLRKFYCKSLNLRQRFTHLTNNLTKFNNLQILATICKSIQFRPNPPKIYSSL